VPGPRVEPAAPGAWTPPLSIALPTPRSALPGLSRGTPPPAIAAPTSERRISPPSVAKIAMSPQFPLAPPFVASPLGQRIEDRGPRTDVTDPLRFTPTPNSPAGGLPGFTRSQGDQAHKGFDDPSRYTMSDISGRSSEVTRWTGAGAGTVTRAGPAYDSHGVYLGERVEITMRDAQGHVWDSKTMHHGEVLVKPGDTVLPWQPIARGTGFGNQFASPKAGGPHVHWELRVDGKEVDPTTGRPFDYIFPKDGQ